MKKTIMILLMVTMILSNTVAVYADVDTSGMSSWAIPEVTSAIELGYVPADLQSDYQAPITRTEFAELMVQAIFTEVNKSLDFADSATKMGYDFDELTLDTFLSKVTTDVQFTDTDNKSVKVANMLGILNGVGNNKFNGEALITREQAAIMFVNYYQTAGIYGGGNARTELGDLESASAWAKTAVELAYRASLIKGTSAVVYNEQEQVVSKGTFNTQGNLTREQAIIIVRRLKDSGTSTLSVLRLRGYVNIGMDELMSGFDIEGNTIKMLKSDYDNKYSAVKEFCRSYSALSYLTKYDSEVLDSWTLTVNGAELLPMQELEEDYLEGSATVYNYGAFNVTVGGSVEYAAVVEKTTTRFFASNGAKLFTVDPGTGYGELVELQ